MLRHIRDYALVQNIIILGTFVFVLTGVSIMYARGELELDHFLKSIDISIGIILGSELLRKIGGENGKR